MRHDPRPYRRPLLCAVVGAIACLCGIAVNAADSTDVKRRVAGPVNEYSPVVYPLTSFDGRTLYFSRKFHPENLGKTRDADDVWSCTLDSTGRWSDATRATVFDTPESDVLCSISPDGKTALLARTQSDNGNPLARLFVMEQTDSGWSAPKQVSVEGFSGRTSHIYAHLSFDNAILFLAVDVPERGMDLFACRRVDTVPQAWRFSRPVPLGDVINTRGTEGSPFLAYDGTTFYFTSDRYGGYGSQDVFMTRRLDSTLTSWTRPVNLGDRINTGFLDHCFSLSADGSTALIVSSDSLFGAGVFEVTLPSSLRMGPSIVGAIVGTDAGTSRRTADTIVLTVTFPTNSTRMRETNVDSVLSSTIHRWRDRPLRILISGHTDRTGIEARNSTLSMRRAVTLRRAVLAALKKRRRSKTSVTFACVGRGISEPVGDDRTEAGRQANRRATARIIIGIGPVASKPDGDLKRSGRAGRRRR